MNNKLKKINHKLIIKNKNYKIIFFIFSFFVFHFLFFIPKTLAAELYLETSKNEYYTKETFITNIRINVGDNESINAIEGHLKFPSDILEVKDFSTGNSILTFIEEPKIDNEKGLISFVGIIPGGYSGRVPGDPGLTNLLGKIIFYSISSGTAEIKFEDISQALLSDGKGTQVELVNKGIIVDIKQIDDISHIQNEWQKELEEDKIPPEDFNPEIIEIDGEYYLVFSAKDKDSGIDHYEILEKDFLTNLSKLLEVTKWINSESPYLLKWQSLNNGIEIKAIDKAGNEKIVKLSATYPLPWYKNYFIWVILITAILYFIWRIIIKQKQSNM
jgi:hypothetical protein